MYMPTGGGGPEREEPPAERHCWGCWTLKAAGYFVAVVETCFLLYMLIYSIVIWNQAGKAHLDAFIVTIVFVILGAILIVLLVMGISGSKHFLLIPHLIAQVLAILMFFIMVIICIVALSGGDAGLQYVINVSLADQNDYYGRSYDPYDRYNNNNNRYNNDNNRYGGYNDRTIPTELHGWIIWKLILYLLMGILEIWFLLIIWALYRYLKADDGKENGESGIYATPQRPPVEPYYEKQEPLARYTPLIVQPQPQHGYVPQSVLYQTQPNFPEVYQESQPRTPSPRPEISFRPIEVQRPAPRRPAHLDYEDDPRFMTRPTPSPGPRISTDL